MQSMAISRGAVVEMERNLVVMECPLEMLDRLWEFDKNLIHRVYGDIVMHFEFLTGSRILFFQAAFFCYTSPDARVRPSISVNYTLA